MRTIFYISFLTMTCCIPILSHAGVQVRTPVVSVDTVPGDEWYGPGYYYGDWYDDPDTYWRWRNDNLDYPPNRAYYHPQRRIYYEGGR